MKLHHIFILATASLMAGNLFSAEVSIDERASIEFSLLVKMVSFADWPDEFDENESSFEVGVFGDHDLYEKLLVQLGRSKNKQVSLLFIEDSNYEFEEASGLRAVYFPSRFSADREFLQILLSRSILPFGSDEDFLEKGGVFRFSLHERAVAFEIDVGWLKKSKVTMRSALLRLAKELHNNSENENINQIQRTENLLSLENKTIAAVTNERGGQYGNDEETL